MAEFRMRCPHCGIEVMANEEWIGLEVECPSCHQKFKVQATGSSETKKTMPPPLVVSSAVSTENNGTFTCGRCGKEIEAKAKRCSHCGVERSWYLAEDDQIKGPYSVDDVGNILLSENSSPEYILAWKAGMSGWCPIPNTELSQCSHISMPDVSQCHFGNSLEKILKQLMVLELIVNIGIAFSGAVNKDISPYVKGIFAFNGFLTFVFCIVIIVDGISLLKKGYELSWYFLYTPLYLQKRADALQYKSELSPGIFAAYCFAPIVIPYMILAMSRQLPFIQ